MNNADVPQDRNAIYLGGRKAVYAVDESGRYGTVASTGWQVEEIVTSAAVDEYRRLALEARARVEAGISAPLEFHMYDRRMDEPMLAETARVWRWRLRRHLRAPVFAGLKPEWIARYAEALGIAPAELLRLPPPPQPPTA